MSSYIPLTFLTLYNHVQEGHKHTIVYYKLQEPVRVCHISMNILNLDFFHILKGHLFSNLFLDQKSNGIFHGPIAKWFLMVFVAHPNAVCKSAFKRHHQNWNDYASVSQRCKTITLILHAFRSPFTLAKRVCELTFMENRIIRVYTCVPC